MNLIGQTISAWTIIGVADYTGHHPKWECRCQCGVVKDVFETSLRSGKSQSCGCLHRLRVNDALLSARLSHGHTRERGYSPEYSAWQSMRARCNNPLRPDYHRYGGRGITVCDQWQDSFETFFADMGEKPSARHSIDRFPDQNGNYEPGNCRWATTKEQANNRRSTKMVQGFGVEMPMVEFCGVLGADYQTVRQRMLRGSSFEHAVLIPRSPGWAAKLGTHVHDPKLLAEFLAQPLAKRRQAALPLQVAA